MVVIVTPKTVNVERYTRTLGETLEAVGNHLGAELAKPLALEAEVDNGVGSVGEIDNRTGEGFVEGSVSVSEASETCGSSKGFGKGVSEGDANILSSVVVIDYTSSVWN